MTRLVRHALLTTTLFAAALNTSACASPPKEDPAATREIPAFQIPPTKPGKTYLRAIVWGDFGTGSQDQHDTAAAMVARVKREKAPLDLMITTGDNFYPKGVESADDSQWKTKFEDVYKAKELQVPVRPSVGNHDHGGNLQAQIEYGKTKNKLWKLPAVYYTFTRDLGEGASIQFFVLDTTPLGWRKNDKPQLAWFDKELAKSKATWKVVVGHHPMYSHSKRPYNTTLIRRLEPLLTKHKVDLYMAGHDHVLEMLKPVKGVNHLVSGAGGGPRKAYRVQWTDKSYYAATRGGFVWLRVGKDELVIEFCRMKGETQFAHTLFKGRTGPF